MKQFKLTFYLPNGVCGEVIIKTHSEKLAYLTACSMLSNYSPDCWEMREEENMEDNK